MTVEWCERKINYLSELNDVEEKREVVDELLIKLSSLTSMELENAASNLDLGRLFAQLTSNSSNYVEDVCKSLAILMAVLEPGDIHKRYPLEIYQYLSHPAPAVKILMLKELDRTAAESEKVHLILNDTNLIIRLIETIGEENLKVATKAMDIVKKIGRHTEGLKIIYKGQLLRAFARLLTKNDVISFRIYEVVVDIATSSKEGLDASINSGFLTSLLKVLDDDDVLLQLNGLEVMTDLANNDDGLHYLEDNNILRKLSDQIARANENPLSSLLIPGLMKFFGHVAKRRPDKIFSKYTVVISALFQVIDGDDLIILGNALDTLGHVASTVEGKYALQSLGDSMTQAIRRISGIIKTMSTELRLRGLDSLALILHVDKDKQDNRILSLIKSWFDLLDNEPLEFIVKISRQPFVDIRSSSMRILVEISTQMWGQEYMAIHPGLIEYLLDRNTESFKNCKELKYEIVKNLAEAPGDLFDATTLQQFQTFIRQGPFYVDLDTEVATESNM